jgi:alpha-1,3/alpha-1,6-mannosyltransferase
VHLILAGGYDARLAENVSHVAELRAAAAAAGVAPHVSFVLSFDTAQRDALLAACAAVLYTPPAEHFGIVPLEAMAAGRAVLACASGGPLETVVHQQTVRRRTVRLPGMGTWLYCVRWESSSRNACGRKG